MRLQLRSMKGCAVNDQQACFCGQNVQLPRIDEEADSQAVEEMEASQSNANISDNAFRASELGANPPKKEMEVSEA